LPLEKSDDVQWIGGWVAFKCRKYGEKTKILPQQRIKHSFLRGGTRSVANIRTEPPRLMHIVLCWVIITCNTVGGYQSFGEILQGILKMAAAF
jgi:hypothetical protein